jgi:hypothetical protein
MWNQRKEKDKAGPIEQQIMILIMMRDWKKVASILPIYLGHSFVINFMGSKAMNTIHFTSVMPKLVLSRKKVISIKRRNHKFLSHIERIALKKSNLINPT